MATKKAAFPYPKAPSAQPKMQAKPAGPSIVSGLPAQVKASLPSPQSMPPRPQPKASAPMPFKGKAAPPFQKAAPKKMARGR